MLDDILSRGLDGNAVYECASRLPGNAIFIIKFSLVDHEIQDGVSLIGDWGSINYQKIYLAEIDVRN